MARLPIVILLLATCASAQPPAPPSFEAVSIRTHSESGPRPTGNAMVVGPRMSLSGPRATFENISLPGLIAFAYDLNLAGGSVVSGVPRWADSDRFDIVAKAAGDQTYTADQFRPMFQTLLADRFKLKFHIDTKEVPGYALVVTKNGPKLKESPPDARSFLRMGGTNYADMTVSRYTMEQFTRQLSVMVDTLPDGSRTIVPVADKTGLTGSYDFTMKWSDDQNPKSDPTFPPLRTALEEQVGLKLESQKVPIKTLIIETVERPSEN